METKKIGSYSIDFFDDGDITIEQTCPSYSCGCDASLVFTFAELERIYKKALALITQ